MASSLAAFLLVCGVATVARSEPIVSSCGFTQQGTTPVNVERGFQIVPVSVNGHPLRMLLDTGATSSALFDGVAGRVGARTDTASLYRVIGVGGTSVRHQVAIDHLTLGGQDIAGTEMAVVHPSAWIAEIADGAIGTDILARWDVEFDIPQRRVSFYRWRNCPEAGPNWIGGYRTLPLDPAWLARGVLVVDGALQGKPTTMMIDSGATMVAVSLRGALAAGVAPAELAHDGRIQVAGIGPNADSAAVLHRFRALAIGGVELGATRSLVLDTPIRAADVMVGDPLFEARKLWISYASHRIFIGTEGLRAQ